MATKSPRPKVGDVYYEPSRDQLLVVRKTWSWYHPDDLHWVFLEHARPGSLRCIMDWPSDLIRVGTLS